MIQVTPQMRVLVAVEPADFPRVKVWQEQPAEFFEEAIIEADGTMTETTGQCKQGMDINYKGQWGYQPLLVSLAVTDQPYAMVALPRSVQSLAFFRGAATKPCKGVSQ